MLMRLEMNDFFEWLAAHHDDESVGQRGQCFHSPLARWLSAKAGFTIGVDGMRYGWALAESCRWVELPRWAQAFATYSEKLFGSQLTAYEAVGLLVEVEVLFSSVVALAA